MAEKKQLPTKYRTRPVTEAQEKEIRKIQEAKGYKSFLEAKNEFFEALDAKEGKESGKELAEKKESKAPKQVKERKTMKISETKLGVTMVLSKEDCKVLGFQGSSATKEVIRDVRKKLGLAERRAVETIAVIA